MALAVLKAKPSPSGLWLRLLEAAPSPSGLSVEASAFSPGGREGAFLFVTQADIKFLAIAMRIWYF